MESIVTFSYPTVSYRCSLNPRGRRCYGTLEDLFRTKSGVPSTVGMADGSTVERTDLRNSLKYSSVVEFDLDAEKINEQFQTLLPDSVRSLWNSTQKYDILEYSEGGFFQQHQDKQLHKHHYGTLLIFPPAVGEFAHTGGELLLDEGRFIFESGSNRDWTFLAFQTHLPHECKKVTSGKRIVLKTELYSTRSTPTIPSRFEVMDGGIHRFRMPSPSFTD
jgi:hypothetical protein